MVAKQVAYMNMDFGSLGGGGDAGQGDGEEPENRLSGAKSSDRASVSAGSCRAGKDRTRPKATPDTAYRNFIPM